jgi:ssDNA-binding Zn-finger/Zn-ribbon topoisomerase 1
MNDPRSPLLPHGGYEHLRSYKVAQAVYDATVVFCDRFEGPRTARQGPHAGQPFWGCSAFPECNGIRAVSGPSDKSDLSDPSDKKSPGGSP